MGQNLIMNIADHGFTVVAFNRTTAKVDRFLENEAKGWLKHSISLMMERMDSNIRSRKIHHWGSLGARVCIEA